MAAFLFLVFVIISSYQVIGEEDFYDEKDEVLDECHRYIEKGEMHSHSEPHPTLRDPAARPRKVRHAVCLQHGSGASSSSRMRASTIAG